MLHFLSLSNTYLFMLKKPVCLILGHLIPYTLFSSRDYSLPAAVKRTPFFKFGSIENLALKTGK